MKSVSAGYGSNTAFVSVEESANIDQTKINQALKETRFSCIGMTAAEKP